MRAITLALSMLAVGCGPSGGPDAGSCAATVRVGTQDAGSFTPLVDGDPAELILGFQGFWMLRFALDVELERGTATEAEVSAFVTVPETGVELGQRTRETALVPTAAGFRIEEWLVFFNDEPPSQVVGHPADVEVIVRAAGCVGGTTARVAIRDDDDCVDTTIVVDAGVSDAGLLDAEVCGTGP